MTDLFHLFHKSSPFYTTLLPFFPHKTRMPCTPRASFSIPSSSRSGRIVQIAIPRYKRLINPPTEEELKAGLSLLVKTLAQADIHLIRSTRIECHYRFDRCCTRLPLNFAYTPGIVRLVDKPSKQDLHLCESSISGTGLFE